jgi:hypothetical protein
MGGEPINSATNRLSGRSTGILHSEEHAPPVDSTVREDFYRIRCLVNLISAFERKFAVACTVIAVIIRIRKKELDQNRPGASVPSPFHEPDFNNLRFLGVGIIYSNLLRGSFL